MVDTIVAIDAGLASWFHINATPPLTQAMRAFTHLHGPTAISIYGILMALYLARRRAWYWFTCLVITLPSGMLLNVLVKHIFQRTRPSFEEPLLQLSTYSFPSGHVAGSTLFYGLLAAMLLTRTRNRLQQAAVLLVAAAMVMLVALSRLYLGVHYLSDVAAAFIEAIAWLGLCLWSIQRRWPGRSE